MARSGRGLNSSLRAIFRTSIHRTQLDGFLLRHRISYKDFGSVVQTISDRVKTHARQFAQDAGRPYIHIKSPSADKNALVADDGSCIPNHVWQNDGQGNLTC